jgi:CRISPR/Cas system-associated endonuclease/helicase Cas3
MILYLDDDERYPDYDLCHKRPYCDSPEVELSDEAYLEWQYIRAQYNLWQRRLQDMAETWLEGQHD